MRALLKYNPVTVAVYNVFLTSRCRSVDAYVFVATTGRSGSESLSRILAGVDGAVCYHEPYPIMYNDCPDGTDPQKYFARNFSKIKRINIRRSAAGYRYYVETNHQFIKNFSSLAVTHFRKKIKIIHLVRRAEAVAGSFYSIGSIPGQTRTGRIYLLDPRSDDNRIQMADLLYADTRFQHDFFKCLWYWYEVETRFKEFLASNPDIPWIEMRTSDLNKKDALLEMVAKLEIKVDPRRIESLVGTHCNRKTSAKSREIPLEQGAEMNRMLLDRMEQRYGKGFWR